MPPPGLIGLKPLFLLLLHILSWFSWSAASMAKLWLVKYVVTSIFFFKFHYCTSSHTLHFGLSRFQSWLDWFSASLRSKFVVETVEIDTLPVATTSIRCLIPQHQTKANIFLSSRGSMGNMQQLCNFFNSMSRSLWFPTPCRGIFCHLTSKTAWAAACNSCG